MATSVNRRIGLRHEEILFSISGEIFYLVLHTALFHLPIGRLDETELVDAGKRAHRANQPDVWPFRSLDRTNAPVMRRMNVAHFESRTLPAETSRSKRRQTAFVRQFRQRICLIHELRELRTPKEISDDCAERFWINQLLRGHPIYVDVEKGHALFDQTLSARQTDAALVRQQFAHGADTSTAEVIDVIKRAFPATQIDQIFDRRDKVFVGQNTFRGIDIDPKFLIDLVPADTAKIVFLRVEKESFEQSTGISDCWGITWSKTAVDIFERLFLIVRWVFSQRLHDCVVIRDVDNFHLGDLERYDLANGCQSERFESSRDRHFAVPDFCSQDLRGQLLFIEFIA